jgi:hypothetical protein
MIILEVLVLGALVLVFGAFEGVKGVSLIAI